MSPFWKLGGATAILLAGFAATGTAVHGAPQATDPASGPPPTLVAPRAGAATGPATPAAQTPASLENVHQFDSKVRPILVQNCYK